MAQPSKPAREQVIKPQPGAQTRFLESEADIALYGGEAGSGKTWALLLEVLRHVHNPFFGSVIFRRTFPQIESEGGLWDKAGELYPLVDAKPNRGNMYWRFPAGCGYRLPTYSTSRACLTGRARRSPYWALMN